MTPDLETDTRDRPAGSARLELNPVHRGRAAGLAAWLRAESETGIRHDQGLWWGFRKTGDTTDFQACTTDKMLRAMRDEGPDCGTACCAAGFVVFDFIRRGGEFENGRSRHVAGAAANLLGLRLVNGRGYEHATWLFEPTRTREELIAYLDEAVAVWAWPDPPTPVQDGFVLAVSA